jgi:hypothetical protein
MRNHVKNGGVIFLPYAISGIRSDEIRMTMMEDAVRDSYLKSVENILWNF